MISCLWSQIPMVCLHQSADVTDYSQSCKILYPIEIFAIKCSSDLLVSQSILWKSRGNEILICQYEKIKFITKWHSPDNGMTKELSQDLVWWPLKKKKNEMDNCKIAGCYNLIPQQRGEDSEFLVSCTSISPSSVPSLI